MPCRTSNLGAFYTRHLTRPSVESAIVMCAPTGVGNAPMSAEPRRTEQPPNEPVHRFSMASVTVATALALLLLALCRVW